MGRWYDRLLALAVLAVLLAALVGLALHTRYLKTWQQSFARWLEDRSPRHALAAPADRALFEEANRLLEQPTQLAPPVRGMMVPERRVRCVNCERPIPYDATNCVYQKCQAFQPPDPEIPKDKDRDGMLDEWEERYSLDPGNPDDAAQDSDADGFTNLEEFTFQTDPRDATKYPPVLAKESVVEIRPIPFRLVFKAVNRIGHKRLFQINLRTGDRTFWAELGQEVEGFKLTEYDDTDPAAPILTLQRGDNVIRLIKGQVVPHNEYEITLHSEIDGSQPKVRIGSEFEIKGARYTVKGVDIKATRVLISDPVRGVDVWIGRRSAGASPEAGKVP
jgi:hypothetical protein